MRRLNLARFTLHVRVYHCLDGNVAVCRASYSPFLVDNIHAILVEFPILFLYRTL